MREIILDGRFMTDKKSVHQYLAEQLEFPDYYGNNLDALYDCLNDICEKTGVSFINTEMATENLDTYFDMILTVFEDAAIENSNLMIK